MDPADLARLLDAVARRDRRPRSAVGYAWSMGSGHGTGGSSGRELDPDERAAWRLARESREPSALVSVALAHPMVFKFVVQSLQECEPDASAARTLIDAHDQGRAPSWLVACLLGFVRHPAGYAKVIEILGRGDRLLSESYAAQSAVLIAGAAAAPDLERVIDTMDGLARKAAASQLASLASPSAIAFLATATSRGRLNARTVGLALARVPVDPDVMTASLRSEHRETRRWPPFTIVERLRFREREHYAAQLDRCGAAPELLGALANVLDEPDELVWSADAKAIRRWLASLR